MYEGLTWVLKRHHFQPELGDSWVKHISVLDTPDSAFDCVSDASGCVTMGGHERAFHVFACCRDGFQFVDGELNAVYEISLGGYSSRCLRVAPVS